MEMSKVYYDKFMNLFRKYDINLFCCYLRGMDSGELCFDYSDEDGLQLFSYDRGSRMPVSRPKSWNDLILRLLYAHCSNVTWRESLATLKPEQKTNEYRLRARIVEFDKVLRLLNDLDKELLISEVSHFESRLNIPKFKEQYRYNICEQKFEICD